MRQRVRTNLLAAAVLGLVVLGLLLAASLLTPGYQSQRFAGDQLGPDSSQSIEQYRAKAAHTLKTAPADQPVFALVGFTGPLTTDEAASIVDAVPLQRTNAIVNELVGVIAVPEPAAGLTRANVFERSMNQALAPIIRDAKEHNADLDVASMQIDRIDSVVVYARGDALRKIAQEDGVDVVETLPPNAVWGSFGVRPLHDLGRL